MTTNKHSINHEFPVYQKQYLGNKGRYKYIPVGAYAEFNTFSKGAHLFIVNDGSTSQLHNVDVDRASVIAAMKIGKDAMLTAMSEASQFVPKEQPITKEQRDLLDKLKATGFNESIWLRASLHDIVDAGMNALENV